jgi:hypothetical protein
MHIAAVRRSPHLIHDNLPLQLCHRCYSKANLLAFYRLPLLQRFDLKVSGDLWQCLWVLGGDIGHSVRDLVADLVAHEIADAGQPTS